MIDTTKIVGHGADADPSSRPGIPREREPRPVPDALAPSPQGSDVTVYVGRADHTLTPVYGTAQPPKGLSGALRRVAYRYPTHLTRHWLLLLLADRLDVVEHRVRRPGGLASVAIAAVGLALAARALRR